MSAGVTILRTRSGTWRVYVGETFISDHATRDGAAVSANQLQRELDREVQ